MHTCLLCMRQQHRLSKNACHTYILDSVKDEMHGRTCPAGREMRIAPHRHNGRIGYMHTSLPLGPNYGTSLRYYRRLSSSGPPESGPSCLSQRLGDTPGPRDPRLVQQVDTTAYSLQPQAGNKADILAFPHGASSDVRRMWKMQRIITTGDMNIPVTARHRACNQRCVQPAASNHLAVPERRPTAQGGQGILYLDICATHTRVVLPCHFLFCYTWTWRLTTTTCHRHPCNCPFSLMLANSKPRSPAV